MAEQIDAGSISDGYHTFNELYEHRHALVLALMKAMPRHFWFSRRHHDGELCFGDGEWFIVGAELPDSGTMSYHLPVRLWGLAELTGAAELERGRCWAWSRARKCWHYLMDPRIAADWVPLLPFDAIPFPRSNDEIGGEQ